MINSCRPADMEGYLQATTIYSHGSYRWQAKGSLRKKARKLSGIALRWLPWKQVKVCGTNSAAHMITQQTYKFHRVSETLPCSFLFFSSLAPNDRSSTASTTPKWSYWGSDIPTSKQTLETPYTWLARYHRTIPCSSETLTGKNIWRCSRPVLSTYTDHVHRALKSMKRRRLQQRTS